MKRFGICFSTRSNRLLGYLGLVMFVLLLLPGELRGNRAMIERVACVGCFAAGWVARSMKWRRNG